MLDGYRHRNRLKKLINDWIQYRATVGHRLGAEGVTPEEERRFLLLKGQIVENLAGLTSGRSSLGSSQELQTHHRGMIDFLTRWTVLATKTPFTDREREDFEREWHRFFLFLNRLKGLSPPTPEKPKGSPIKPVPTPSSSVSWRIPGLGRLVGFVLRLAALVAAIWVLVTIVPWERITGGRIRGVIPDSWSSVRETVSGFRFPTLGGVFDPVVDRYGPEATSIMVAVLLVALGYWLFVRMK